MRVERWVRTSVPAHPKGCCCGVYKGTNCPHTPCTPQRMLVSGLQRYYLSPHTPTDAGIGSTKVLPLPTHPNGCWYRVYKGTTSPHTLRTPQEMLLSDLQRYYLSPDTLTPLGLSHTSDLKALTIQRLLCQAPGVTESALGLVGPVSEHCD